MWKLLAKTPVIMERIPKHSVGLFTILLFIIDFSSVYCATVTGNDVTGMLGQNNTVTIKCDYTLESGESAQTMSLLRQRATEGSFSEIVSFNIAANSSFFTDQNLVNRGTLILLADSTGLRLKDVLCTDAATYRCVFAFGKNSIIDQVQNTMSLVVEADPLPPVIPAAYNPNRKTFEENKELEVRCEGDVGLPAKKFLWFGYRSLDRYVDFTALADPGEASNINTGPRFCVFRRESSLKFNLTRDDNNLVIRCVVNHTIQGRPPVPTDQCEPATCKQSSPIVVEYPVRDEDLQVSSNPRRDEYIVGSDVTLRCTVDGNPAPYFRWEKDGDENMTVEDKDVWTLMNLKLGDGGIYRCYANNTVGGIAYNASKPIYINVVETTTTSSTTATTPTSTESTGGKTEPVKTGGGGDNTTTIIIAVCVVLGVLLIVAAIVAFIIIRKKRAKSDRVEEPPEKPYNKNNLHMYSAKPDLVTDEKKQNYNYKNDDGLTYADLKFDDKPRSRRPVALADNMTDYADITIPQV